MSHLFVKLKDSSNYESIQGPALVVKNVSAGPFVVDEEGRTLHSMGVAAVEESCTLCSAGIKNGKLVVLCEISGVKPQKTKTKSVPASDEQVAATVAPSGDNDSVQWESN